MDYKENYNKYKKTQKIKSIISLIVTLLMIGLLVSVGFMVLRAETVQLKYDNKIIKNGENVGFIYGTSTFNLSCTYFLKDNAINVTENLEDYEVAIYPNTAIDYEYKVNGKKQNYSDLERVNLLDDDDYDFFDVDVYNNNEGSFKLYITSGTYSILQKLHDGASLEFSNDDYYKLHFFTMEIKAKSAHEKEHIISVNFLVINN